jgi:DNA-binding MarR family transcriptional regulator
MAPWIDTREREDIVREVIALLPGVVNAVHRRTPECARREDVSVAQVKVFVHLAEYGPRTMTELAEGLGVTLPSATGLVSPLVGMGFVVRERDELDRRVVRVRLSPSAQTLADRIMAERRAQVEAALADLSPEARCHFVEGLRRMVSVFSGEE